MANGDRAEVVRFIDWAYGKEADATHGAAARFVAAHATRRPAAGTEARWADFDALKTHARNFGPAVTESQLDAAIAAYRAS